MMMFGFMILMIMYVVFYAIAFYYLIKRMLKEWKKLEEKEHDR